MNGRRSIIVVDDFYDDPALVREYALEQKYYLPYQKDEDLEQGERAKWWSSWYRPHNECPFKSSRVLISRLEDIVGENIDMTHWNATYPVNSLSKPMIHMPGSKKACLWHCSFHVKLDLGQKLGNGVHNHVTDNWNSVGAEGWAGLLYLAEDAPVEGGLNLWRNINPANIYDWMSAPQNWVHLDRFANLYNRLILVRGNIPHSGANGWGTDIKTGRMFQTFFFKTTTAPKSFSVSITKSDLYP